MEQPVIGSSLTLGKTLLKERGLYSTETWYWICIEALIGFSVLFNALFIAALTYMKGKSIYSLTYREKMKRKKSIYLLMIQLHAILEGSIIPSSSIDETRNTINLVNFRHSLLPYFVETVKDHHVRY